VKTEGKVYLVGAGPGDPGLFTVRGVHCLQNADVLLYDNLVPEKLLSYVNESAEKFYVGKKAGRHTLSQDKINALLVKKAREGKIVVRLKGGDPFIFGRGGEEALELVKNDVPFEVVPGVTAASAVSAYAGIPLTHRDFASSLAFVTGHENPLKEKSAIRWAELAAGAGTLVVFMGVKNLQVIAEALMKYGKSEKTPVAVIRRGTFPDQKVITGTLGDIAGRAEEENLQPPALVVIGGVVSLREKLNWYESRLLFGKRIVVTRSRAQASTLVAMLEELGAETIEIPIIKIAAVEDYSALDEAVGRVADYDWLIFTSVNGVQIFFERFFSQRDTSPRDTSPRDTSPRDIRGLSGVKLAAIGPATKKELESFHLLVDFQPREYVAECFTDEFIQRYRVKNRKFLLISSDRARDHIEKTFTEHDGLCTVIVGYRTIAGEAGRAEIERELEGRSVDWVTFTSSSTVNNFFKLYRGEKRFKIASIGPITSQAIRDAGFSPDVEAREHTIPGLVEAMLGFYGGGT